jgi:hypothetical protein
MLQMRWGGVEKTFSRGPKLGPSFGFESPNAEPNRRCAAAEFWHWGWVLIRKEGRHQLLRRATTTLTRCAASCTRKPLSDPDRAGFSAVAVWLSCVWLPPGVAQDCLSVISRLGAGAV